jgi:hypothetical protein
MNNHQNASSSSGSFPEEATAQAAVQPSTQASPEQASAKAPRSWFKKKRLMLPLALIAVIATILAVNSSGTKTLASSPKAQPLVADIGTKVRDGAFEFVVTGIERPGKTMTGKLNSTLTAQGEFVIVRVDVTNVSKTAQRLGCSCHYLFTDEGHRLSPSASILSTKDALKYVSWINPGDTVKNASVLFDVAAGAKVFSVELHDSIASRGALVKLN